MRLILSSVLHWPGWSSEDGPKEKLAQVHVYRATVLFMEVCNFIITFAPCT